jgi:hypothetical protein
MELILQKKPAPRPVMFDFIIGSDKEKMLVGNEYRNATELERVITNVKAFDSAGFDHACIVVRGMTFPRKTEDHPGVQTKSLNVGATIVDWQSFGEYHWPELSDCDFSILEEAGKYLDPRVRFIPFSLDGILENTIGIMGYENLCLALLYDDPDLVAAVSRLSKSHRSISRSASGTIVRPGRSSAMKTGDSTPTKKCLMLTRFWQSMCSLGIKKNRVEKAHACAESMPSCIPRGISGTLSKTRGSDEIRRPSIKEDKNSWPVETAV